LKTLADVDNDIGKLSLQEAVRQAYSIADYDARKKMWYSLLRVWFAEKQLYTQNTLSLLLPQNTQITSVSSHEIRRTSGGESDNISTLNINNQYNNLEQPGTWPDTSVCSLIRVVFDVETKEVLEVREAIDTSYRFAPEAHPVLLNFPLRQMIKVPDVLDCLTLQGKLGVVKAFEYTHWLTAASKEAAAIRRRGINSRRLGIGRDRIGIDLWYGTLDLLDYTVTRRIQFYNFDGEAEFHASRKPEAEFQQAMATFVRAAFRAKIRDVQQMEPMEVVIERTVNENKPTAAVDIQEELTTLSLYNEGEVVDMIERFGEIRAYPAWNDSDPHDRDSKRDHQIFDRRLLKRWVHGDLYSNIKNERRDSKTKFKLRII
jgi:hypothetical protein